MLDVVTDHDNCYDNSDDVRLTLPYSKDFSKVIKEISESKATENQTNRIFEMQTMNIREQRNNQFVSSETGDKGLLRRRKMSVVLKPSESFPAEIEPRARRASFPAIKSTEVDLELNFS